MKKGMNRKGQLNVLHVVIGILLIGGGILYLLGQNSLGAVIAGFGVFVEILINWVKNLT